MGFRIATALAVGLCAVCLQGCGSESSVHTYVGTTDNVSNDGTAVSIVASDGARDTFLVGNGVEWLGVDQSWRETGTAHCLPPRSSGAKIVVKTINYSGRQRVLQIECESLPTEIHWSSDMQPLSLFHGYCQEIVREGLTPTLTEDDPCVDS